MLMRRVCSHLSEHTRRCRKLGMFGLGWAGAYLLSGAVGTLVALFVNRQMVQDR
jgi:hypothetical protein